MNCPNHPEMPAVAYCRTCGRPLCAQCQRPAQGVVYCEEHTPAPTYTAKPADAAPAPGYAGAPRPTLPGEPSPGLAFLLGFIPGVGAIYNGQYAKGLIHAIIFGLLISIMSADATGGFGPLFGMLLTAWVFYMVFEAYHTAAKRRAGEVVDEFSSLVNLRRTGSFPAGAIILILLGVVLLLNTLDILQFRYIARYWPVVLIAIGVYMLYARFTPQNDGGPGVGK